MWKGVQLTEGEQILSQERMATRQGGQQENSDR